MIYFSEAELWKVGRALAITANQEIMPRFGKIASLTAYQKTSAFDIVTEADEAAERAIGERLAEELPRLLLIGEEAAERNSDLLGQLDRVDAAILIDPLDRMKNFASKLAHFGMMASVASKGEIVAGASYGPICRDGAYAIRERVLGRKTSGERDMLYALPRCHLFTRRRGAPGQRSCRSNFGARSAAISSVLARRSSCGAPLMNIGLPAPVGAPSSATTASCLGTTRLAGSLIAKRETMVRISMERPIVRCDARTA